MFGKKPLWLNLIADVSVSIAVELFTSETLTALIRALTAVLVVRLSRGVDCFLTRHVTDVVMMQTNSVLSCTVLGLQFYIVFCFFQVVTKP